MPPINCVVHVNDGINILRMLFFLPNNQAKNGYREKESGGKPYRMTFRRRRTSWQL